MKERIALNPMQQSYLRGREAKYGRFSKACFVYEYDPTKVEHARLVEALQRLPQLHPPRRKKLRQKMSPPPMHRILQIPRPKSPFRRRLPPRQHRYMAAFWRGPHWMSTPMPPLRTASSTMSPRNRAASGWPFPRRRVPAQNRASTPFTPSNLPALCWWAM